MIPSTPLVWMTWRLRPLVRRSQRINGRETRIRIRHGHRARGDTWTIGPTRPGLRKHREPSPWAPHLVEVEDALPPAVGSPCPRSSSLLKRRNQMPRSRLSSTSSWTTAFVSTMPQHGCPRVLPLLTRTAACAVGSICQSPTEVVVSPNEAQRHGSRGGSADHCNRTATAR